MVLACLTLAYVVGGFLYYMAITRQPGGEFIRMAEMRGDPNALIAMVVFIVVWPGFMAYGVASAAIDGWRDRKERRFLARFVE